MINPLPTNPAVTVERKPVQPWQPLLTGAQQTAALSTISTIAEHLSTQPVLSAYDPDLALFFAYLHLTYRDDDQGDEAYAAHALHCLEQAIQRVATTPLSAALYGGLAGVGWSLAHIGRLLPEVDAEDSNAVIDELLYNHIEQTPWQADYDLIGGLVGIGVYALERLPNPLAVDTLARIVDRLDELAVVTPAGITWFTPPALLPDHQRAQFPDGYYNLGVAHGVPGVIALLGRTYAAGVATAKARCLLDGAVAWLLAQQIEQDGEGGFPAWVAPAPVAQSTRPTRSAWCYGDPGIAAALLGAARGVNEPTWEAAALTIARRAAQRAVEQAGIKDACVCHGAAGLGHIFNRLYQATGEGVLSDAARFWFEHALSLQRPGQGIAGFCNWMPGDTWVDDPGFLTGAVGVALALLAASGDVEPAWDRLLLLDIAPV